MYASWFVASATIFYACVAAAVVNTGHAACEDSGGCLKLFDGESRRLIVLLHI